MHSRRDPRAEPDDVPSESGREDHVSRSVPSPPESAKQRASATPRPRRTPETASVVETSDLVELPQEQPTSYAQARHAAATSPSSGSMRAAPSQMKRSTPEAAPPSRPASSSNVVTNLDPRLEQIEPIIDGGNWHTVGQKLGSLQESGRLPPTLGLIAAVAHTELAGETGCPEASDLAIRCMAGVFGVTTDSAIGRVLAKRLLRRSQRLAPVRPSIPAASAFVLLAAFLAIGLIGGYLIGSGTVKVHF